MIDFFNLRGNVIQLLEAQNFRVQTLDRRPGQPSDLIIRPKKFCEFDDLAGWPSDEKGTYATARLFERQKNVPTEIQIEFDGTPMGAMTDDCTLYLFYRHDDRSLIFHRSADIKKGIAAGQYPIQKRGSYTVALIP